MESAFRIPDCEGEAYCDEIEKRAGKVISEHKNNYRCGLTKEKYGKGKNFKKVNN